MRFSFPNCVPAAVNLLLLGVVLAGSQTSAAAQGQQARWLTGRALDQALRLPVGIGWPDNPLGDSVRRLSINQQVAVMLDRRVDPDRQVSLKVQEPLQQVFVSIVSEHNTRHARSEVLPRPAERLAATRLGDVIVISPANANAVLRTVAENRLQDVKKLPPTRQGAWLRKTPLVWQSGATPREILERWAQEHSFRISKIDILPHDVWPAADFPPMSSVEALSLVLANFDLTFQISANGAQADLKPIEAADCRIEKLYAGGANPPGLAADLAAALPDAEIEIRGTQIVINARMEEHEWISGDRERGDSPVGGTQVHSLKVENQPVGAVIDYLAENLKFEARWDEQAMQAAGITRDALVSFEVVKKPLDELLKAVLGPAGLVHQREGDIVRISPKK